jgi:hypothetical protein
MSSLRLLLRLSPGNYFFRYLIETPPSVISWKLLLQVSPLDSSFNNLDATPPSVIS